MILNWFFLLSNKSVMKFIILLFAMTTTAMGQSVEPDPNKLYEAFIRGYDEWNEELLASLYTNEAEALNLYDMDNPNSMKGRLDILQYYKNFFSAYKLKDQRLLLTFKIINRTTRGSNILDNGFYRLEIITPNKPSAFAFGRFSTVLECVDSSWKFKTDATTNAVFLEFENADGIVIPRRDDLLYPQFYDLLLGNYSTADNQIITIGRSQRRLFALFEKSNSYYGLNKINAFTWSRGNTVISNEAIQTFQFVDNKIKIFENNKLISIASKVQLYKNEYVTYQNNQAVHLAGTLFIPKKSNGKSIVLIHGSGPQDRNGYVSIIRVLADILVREGITVLTYDKQGVGQSEGNSSNMSFAELAEDALAGINYLKSRTDLKLSQYGLGGSSQAGWIIAKAIEHKKQTIDFVLAIGAAGCGISAVDQNIYNTQATMKCSLLYSDEQIEKAITQQKYFFDFLKNPASALTLDNYTRSVSSDTLIRDWLFPMSGQIEIINSNQWYTALEISYDPLTCWKNYNNPCLMLFGEYDDSTPTELVAKKVNLLKNKNIKTVSLTNCQHIGLLTDSVCKNDLAVLNRFHQDFFMTIRNWLKTF